MNPVVWLANLIIELFGLTSEASHGIVVMLSIVLVVLAVFSLSGLVVWTASKMGLVDFE